VTTDLLHPELTPLRDQLGEIVKSLHSLAIQTGNDELGNTVSDLRLRLNEPFMFVIVGEVKAGKSSFVNALLSTGKEVAKVAPQPMTDTIQQILYGEEETVTIINPHLKKIYLPVEILREIAIVDTPGTNTIVEHHQEITERFIPYSDLIVFVFEAKNPYRQSSWAFFDYVNEEWRRKVIFVLQQKDLIDEEGLQINVNGVEEQARKKGMKDPRVFAVSAKLEQEGQTNISGFDPLRDYIRENITGGQAPLLKMINNVDTAININEKIGEGIHLRRAQWEADQAFRADIRETLALQEVKSHKQVDVLVENLLAGYDRITLKKEQELRSGLSFFSLLKRTISGMFSKKQSAKEWLEGLSGDLETELNTELRQKLNEGVVDLADSIQQMAKLIDLKIRSSETILKNDHELFSDIAERRENILRELQDTFTDFVENTENFRDASLFPDRQALTPNLAAGGGIAAIGVILMAVTNGMVFDITGGLLTGVGLLFAGVSTSIKRGKILEGFRDEVESSRLKIEQEVTEKLKLYISHLKKRIDHNFRRFDQLLEQESANLKKIESSHEEVSAQLGTIRDRLHEKR
jgi:GTPase SAR1 family protein